MSTDNIINSFREIANKYPNKIALQYKDKSLTYEELEKKTNQFSWFLKDKGVIKNDRVMIMVENSIELIISILGTFKVGAVYIPINHNSGDAYLKKIIYESNSKYLILSSYTAQFYIDSHNISSIICEESFFSLYSSVAFKENSFYSEADLYINFTSGTTGVPKGVLIEQKSVFNYIKWCKKTYYNKEDNISMPLFTSPSFDLTITSIFYPLLTAGKIIIYKNSNPVITFYNVIKDNKVNVIKLTPSHLKLLNKIPIIPSNLKVIIVGGEQFETCLARRIYKLLGENIDIYNEYGPTEATVGCICHKFNYNIDNGNFVPIGKVIDNMKIYIKNKNLKELRLHKDCVGELYIGGIGLAKGYINNEEKMKEDFITDELTGERLYKSGDIVAVSSSGNLIYVGRNDQQIKKNGYRINLKEIEYIIKSIDSIEDCIVVYLESTQEIVAYYTVKTININEGLFDEKIRSQIPDYMYPNVFIKINSIPITSGGKVDYKKLREFRN